MCFGWSGAPVRGLECSESLSVLSEKFPGLACAVLYSVQTVLGVAFCIVVRVFCCC